MKRDVLDYWDVFISYASEDRRHVVEPLVKALEGVGVSVWYDKFELRIGDSLRQKIDEGLAHSKQGIVILSPHFFGKQFTNWELNGLVQREAAGKKVILPVWHQVSVEEVRRYSPPLADKVAANWKDGVSIVLQQLLRTIRPNLTASESGSKARSLRDDDLLFAGYQGDACPKCGDGMMWFLKWDVGPAGSFTAWYKCNRCGAMLPSDHAFDGGSV